MHLPTLIEEVRTRGIYTPILTAANRLKAIVTYLMFWTMIECGLSLIVVCLPTLRPLLAKVTPYSILNSIRSTFSLRSFSKQQSADEEIGRIDSFTRMTSSKSMRPDTPGFTSGEDIELRL